MRNVNENIDITHEKILTILDALLMPNFRTKYGFNAENILSRTRITPRNSRNSSVKCVFL